MVAHPDVVRRWARSRAWREAGGRHVRFLGPFPGRRAARIGTRQPRGRAARYAQEKENHYNFTKPFTPGHRDNNVRLLHSFLVVAEHLRVPQGGASSTWAEGPPG